MGSRAVEGWDGWGQWQLSTAETRTDWRSDHPVALDVPSAAIFSLRRARAAQWLTCDFVDGGAVGWLLLARTSFSPLSLDSSAGEKVYKRRTTLGRTSSYPAFLLWKLYGKFAKAVLSIHAIFDSHHWNSVKRYFAKGLYLLTLGNSSVRKPSTQPWYNLRPSTLKEELLAQHL